MNEENVTQAKNNEIKLFIRAEFVGSAKGTHRWKPILSLKSLFVIVTRQHKIVEAKMTLNRYFDTNDKLLNLVVIGFLTTISLAKHKNTGKI